MVTNGFAFDYFNYFSFFCRTIPGETEYKITLIYLIGEPFLKACRC
jgi:hypothetical protein